MFRLLQTLSWRHVRRHQLRTALTFLGIALGVAVIVAIAMVNRSLTSSFQSTIEQIAGKAVLQVANGESGINESLFSVIRDTPGVQDAAAAVEGFLPVSGKRGERLYVYGVDLLTDFAIRDHQFAGSGFAFDQALDFIAQPDSVALTESFARRLHLPIGAQITLATARGKQNYTVRALLKEEGTARVFGGNFALMDLPAAQRSFGKEGKLDIIDLTVEEGAKIETVQQRLKSRLAGAAEVERPKKRGEQIESLLISFRVGLFFVSLIALFVGFFLLGKPSMSVHLKAPGKRPGGQDRARAGLGRRLWLFFVSFCRRPSFFSHRRSKGPSRSSAWGLLECSCFCSSSPFCVRSSLITGSNDFGNPPCNFPIIRGSKLDSRRTVCVEIQLAPALPSPPS